jgi:Holliday junction resolvasome RuvABC endonuclease subunit
MKVLGIDPSLNNVGYFIYPGPFTFHMTESPPPSLSQFEKIRWQAAHLTHLLSSQHPTHVGIEQPYVQSFGAKGGGHQSANMWAVYNLLLDKIAEAHLPALMINISQLRALIRRKRDTSKVHSIEVAYQCTGLRLNEHEADAFHVAKAAYHFWALLEGQITTETLTPDQQDIFCSQREVTGGKSGIIWRPGDFWYDFRSVSNPLAPNLPAYGALCRSLTP